MKFLLIACLVAAASASLAPLYNVKQKIEGSYIIVLKNGESLTATVDKLRSSPYFTTLGGRIDRVFGKILNGFSATLGEKALEFIRNMDVVDYVEEDGMVRTFAVASWGLDRVNQRYGTDGSYSTRNDGSGVHVYVIDTGIRASHSDFSGRVGTGYDAVDGGSPDDCNGHGTHCAGTVGGSSYGVAKGVTLHGVRVLNCAGSGSNSGVIDGVNWVGINCANPGKCVASMSLGGGTSLALDNAVNNLVSDGIVTIVAAGNENQDACNCSPARATSALTVGATGYFPTFGSQQPDARATYSNFGNCVTMFAPGTDITSAWYTSNTASRTISGTSMATPHIAGAAALYLQTSWNGTPSKVNDYLRSLATEDCNTKGPLGSPSCLLYVGDL